MVSMLGVGGRRSLAALVAGGLLTAVVVLTPSVRFAYRSSGGHLVLETSVALAAALVALLLYGRYRRSASLRDLLLGYAMALLSGMAAVLVAWPLLAAGDDRTAPSWAALVVRLVGACLILAAALVPPERRYVVAHPWRQVLLVAGACALGILAIALLSTRLPDAVRVDVPAEASATPSFDGHPVVLVAQVASIVCFAIAAVAFTRQSSRSHDEMLSWFGAGCTLAVWAHLSYLMFPSLYTDWLYIGDFFRLGFYALLLVGAVREIRAYWEAQATAAVAEERRRLSRELHDGVVQELGWMRSALLRGVDGPEVVAAADRALDEARRALSALSAPPDEPLDVALQRAVSEVGDRHDVTVHLDLEDVTVPAAHREALVRIAREAVSNAIRHGMAGTVNVRLRSGLLAVDDSGAGFDAQQSRPHGFGLTSMRERAEGIGARLQIRSAPGRGTCVEVTW